MYISVINNALELLSEVWVWLIICLWWAEPDEDKNSYTDKSWVGPDTK